MLLNVYLAQYLDASCRELPPDLSLLRTADDLLSVCELRDEAEDGYKESRRMLPEAGTRLTRSAGNTMKEVRRGDTIRWRGFEDRGRDDGISCRRPAGLRRTPGPDPMSRSLPPSRS